MRTPNIKKKKIKFFQMAIIVSIQWSHVSSTFGGGGGGGGTMGTGGKQAGHTVVNHVIAWFFTR